MTLPEPRLLPGKLRPELQLAGPYRDWLVCGISSRVADAVNDWDEVLQPGDPEFAGTGLKVPSVIRLSWLVSVSADVASAGPYLGQIATDRLHRVRRPLAEHLG